MTETEFIDFARAAALRATSSIGRIGHLVCTQAKNAQEPRLREPEMRTAFQQEAEARGLFYGIEVPTAYTYQFTGVGKRRALVDFALLDSSSPSARRDVLVELKEGQPNGVRLEDDALSDYPKITKDLHKLWAEPGCHGRCMFHICQAADAGTIPALMDKYNAVTQNAINLSSETILRSSGLARGDMASNEWFLLLILVLHQRPTGTGSFLHRAKWLGGRWQSQPPERL